MFYPDTLVGTDSHTTMINGLGIVGWGVGGIEAEAGMLGQPVYFLTPDVVGVHMTGRLAEGVTATDLALHCTEMLRRGEGRRKVRRVSRRGRRVASAAPTAPPIANMAPEYGATMGFFPIDEETCKYLLATGRSREHVETFRNYYQAQGLFGIPRGGECDYSQVLELDLGVRAAERLRTQAPAGPHRAAGSEESFPRAAGEAGRRERLRQEAREPAPPLPDDDRL